MWDVLNSCPKFWTSSTSFSINKIFEANCLFPHPTNWNNDWTLDFCSSKQQTRLGIKLPCYKICKAFKECFCISSWLQQSVCDLQLCTCLVDQMEESVASSSLCAAHRSSCVALSMLVFRHSCHHLLQPTPCLTRSGKGQCICSAVHFWESPAMEIPRSKDRLCYTLCEDWFICHIPSTAKQPVQKLEGALKCNEFAK